MPNKNPLSRNIKMKLLIVILITNALTYLIAMPAEQVRCEQQPSWTTPNGLEQIKIRARLLTSFRKGKKVSIFNHLNNHIVNGILVNQELSPGPEFGEDGEFIHLFVAVPQSSIQQFAPDKIYHLYPEINSIATPTKENYEVTY